MIIFTKMERTRFTKIRRKWVWTPMQLDRLQKIQIILDDLEPYLPLTIRQIFYQFVSRGWLENTLSQYGILIKLLKL